MSVVRSTIVNQPPVPMGPAQTSPMTIGAIAFQGGLGAIATRILTTAHPTPAPTGSVSTRSMATLALVRKDGEEATVTLILTSVRTILATKMLCALIRTEAFVASVGLAISETASTSASKWMNVKTILATRMLCAPTQPAVLNASARMATRVMALSAQTSMNVPRELMIAIQTQSARIWTEATAAIVNLISLGTAQAVSGTPKAQRHRR